MRPAASPHAAPVRSASLSLVCTTVLLVSLGHEARAEVWPAAVAAQVHGPGAVLEPGPLALWTNPALLSGHRGVSVGAGWLEPFSVPLLARADAAVGVGGGSWGMAAGATRFGEGELAASRR